MAGKKAFPFEKFEKSKGDREPRSMREGSKREEALDHRQMKKPPMKKGRKGC